RDRTVTGVQTCALPISVHWNTVGHHLAALMVAGEVFLFCRNVELPFPDGTVDYVFSNSMPVDINTWLGPGVQSSEIRRVLRAGEIGRASCRERVYVCGV